MPNEIGAHHISGRTNAEGGVVNAYTNRGCSGICNHNPVS